MTIGMILHKYGPACSRCTWKLPFFDSNNTCKHLSIKCAQNAEVHPQICIIIIGNHFSTTRKDLSKPHKKHCHLLCIVLFVVSTSNHTANWAKWWNASHKHQITVNHKDSQMFLAHWILPLKGHQAVSPNYISQTWCLIVVVDIHLRGRRQVWPQTQTHERRRKSKNNRDK